METDIEIFLQDDYGTLTTYRSNIIPRVGEKIKLSHFGLFKVKEVIYFVSDDSYPNDHLIYISVSVERS